MPTQPQDVARLGHRYQVIVSHATSGRTLVASRVQRIEPTIRMNTDVYYELGTIDPVGSSSDAPEFRIQLDENVHSTSLDLLLAGKTANATTWNLGDYISDGDLEVYILERDTSGTIAGEVQFSNGVITDITWQWQMGQPITARYSIDARLGKRWTASEAPHQTWGTQDTTSPGGIKIKDARLFLGNTSSGGRMYRLQSFTLRVSYRTTAIREAGNRAIVGYVVEPPETTLDIELNAADHQPDDIVYSGASATPPYSYYDYVNPVQLSQSAIRIYNPAAAEGTSVIRSWKIENLFPANSTPILA